LEDVVFNGSGMCVVILNLNGSGMCCYSQFKWKWYVLLFSI
jgi:hypothetical protein